MSFKVLKGLPLDNLLDNSNFRDHIINSNNQSTYRYNDSEILSIDRWYVLSGCIRVSSAGIYLEPNTTILQYVNPYEGPYRYNPNYRIRIQYRSDINVVVGFYRSNDPHDRSHTENSIINDDDGYYLQGDLGRWGGGDITKFYITNNGNDDLLIYSMKLEKSSTSNFSGDKFPTYLEDLFNCYRYYQKLYYNYSPNTNDQYIRLNMSYLVPMIDTPEVTDLVVRDMDNTEIPVNIQSLALDTTGIWHIMIDQMLSPNKNYNISMKLIVNPK